MQARSGLKQVERGRGGRSFELTAQGGVTLGSSHSSSSLADWRFLATLHHPPNRPSAPPPPVPLRREMLRACQINF